MIIIVFPLRILRFDSGGGADQARGWLALLWPTLTRDHLCIVRVSDYIQHALHDRRVHVALLLGRFVEPNALLHVHCGGVFDDEDGEL